MINGKDNNASMDNRGLFVRFLNPIWQGITNKMSLHNGILGAVKNELEKTQKDMVDSALESYLSTATGSFLDHWGEFIGLSRRPNESDESYRARIEKYITVLRSTIPAIQDALYDYFGDYNANINIYEPFRDIFYTNKSMLNGKDHLQGNYYRYAVIDISIDRPFDYDEVMAIIDKFKPAGVLVHITYNPSLQLGFGIVTGLYDNFGIVATLRELQYFTGYYSSKKDVMVLATKDMMSKNNIFRTNKSLTNSTDVLAGSALQGDRPSFHGAFLNMLTTQATNTSTIQELINRGVECDNDMYTATSHPGGAKAEVNIEKDYSLNFAFDLLEYHLNTSKEEYITKEIKYIKVTLAESNSGMDLGYLTALGKDGVDKAVGAKWSVAVEGEKPFRVFNNGDNLINTLDRRSFATLQLTEPAVLKSIQIDNAYNGAVEGGIYVSSDGEEYYNVFYGTFSNKVYPLIDVSSIEGSTINQSGTTYGDFLAGIYGNAEFHMYVDAGRVPVEYGIQAWNFDTSDWETIHTQSTGTRPYTELITTVTGDLNKYISDVGIILVRLRPHSIGELKVDYVGVVLTNHIGFRYSLEFPMQLRKPELAQQLELIKLDMTTLQDTILPSMGDKGESGAPEFSYAKPLNKIRAEISIDSGIDPNSHKYFRTSKGRESEVSADYGFDTGMLAEEGVATDSRAVITYKRINGLPDVSYEVPIRGSNLLLDMYGWDYTITEVEIVLYGGTFTGKAFRTQIENGAEIDISHAVIHATTLKYTNNTVGDCTYLYEDHYWDSYLPIDKHFYTRSITNIARGTVDTELTVSSEVAQKPIA